MNRCYYTKSVKSIRNKITYSYKCNNSQYMNKSDYMIMYINKILFVIRRSRRLKNFYFFFSRFKKVKFNIYIYIYIILAKKLLSLVICS